MKTRKPSKRDPSNRDPANGDSSHQSIQLLKTCSRCAFCKSIREFNWPDTFDIADEENSRNGKGIRLAEYYCLLFDESLSALERDDIQSPIRVRCRQQGDFFVPVNSELNPLELAKLKCSVASAGRDQLIRISTWIANLLRIIMVVVTTIFLYLR